MRLTYQNGAIWLDERIWKMRGIHAVSDYVDKLLLNLE